MRVIACKSLQRSVNSLKRKKDQKSVASALEAWFHEAKEAEWRNSADVPRAYANASIVGADRVVFHIKGNEYRLVAAIDYRLQIVFVKSVGSHVAYDKIGVKTVRDGR